MPRGVAFLYQSDILDAKFPQGGNAMCDYSLAHYPNRFAVEGEQLQVYRFSTGTVGLVPQCPNFKETLSPTAVCVPPGARLLLQDIPQSLQEHLNVAEVEEVAFIEQTFEPGTHRDAVRFANGRELLLQRLCRGQRLKVLNLGDVNEASQELQNEGRAFVLALRSTAPAGEIRPSR
jgi:hypothetical protein